MTWERKKDSHGGNFLYITIRKECLDKLRCQDMELPKKIKNRTTT